MVKGKACDGCLLKNTRIYAYTFETPLPEDAEILRLYPRVPHPFVIEPPADEKLLFIPGDSFSFNLILVGKAIDYIPYFIYTFTELGKQGIGKGRGKYDLIKVDGIGLNEACVQIYNGRDQVLTNQYPVIDSRQLSLPGIAPVSSSGEGEDKGGGNPITMRHSQKKQLNSPDEGEYQSIPVTLTDCNNQNLFCNFCKNRLLKTKQIFYNSVLSVPSVAISVLWQILVYQYFFKMECGSLLFLCQCLCFTITFC
ncbi:MAG: hypothetical protein MRJ65_11220 [Candidatus Brocadiaceae bacterium]|nr:hypothetical protein [Candidatus Brocadiaceae bacterium]